MNLAQDAGFCARHTVTHVVAVGAPVDFKRPADPRTWVASVTNQHDIIPTLDGQGAGGCFELHPDWYVVDYFDSTHLFPLCHSIEHYLANLVADLPEERGRIDTALSAYRGPVVREQAYLLFDRAPHPEGFPFLTVPTRMEEGVELPVRCQDGSALTAWFGADPAAADLLLEGTGFGQAVRAGGRALVVVHAAWNRRSSLGAYRELHLGVVVADPWRSRSLLVWPDLLRGADRRRSGLHLAGSVVDAERVAGAASLVVGRRAVRAAGGLRARGRKRGRRGRRPAATARTARPVGAGRRKRPGRLRERAGGHAARLRADPWLGAPASRAERAAGRRPVGAPAGRPAERAGPRRRPPAAVRDGPAPPEPDGHRSPPVDRLNGAPA
ncbi:hypothetical protein [Nonomuraea dietziae]|uniref:hypothetical protein n=1 Tax=Nonomuraea dietziae TaxID=65515 RepID=UPI0031DF8CC5